ncbi:hypothetical protein ACI2L1_37160 [Streptomyces sp. NPDC019531]|uniref:hypothetical protein n=1 Tax=Streptomyces sp. NPDC019531 TaxID=3365062 RepID=UPI00384A81ED
MLVSLCAATYAERQAASGRSDRAGFDPLITELHRTPVSSRQLGMQVWAWGYFGGAGLMGDYERALAGIDRSVRPDGSVDGTAMRRGCTDLLSTIDRAEDYFPVPASAEQSLWSAVLSSSRIHAQDCLDTLPVTHWEELRPVLTALNPPVDPVAALFDDLVELAKPAGMELSAG